MNELQKWIATRQAISAKIKALLSFDSLTAEQEAEHDKLVAEFEAADKTVARLKAQAAREEKSARDAADADDLAHRTATAMQRADRIGEPRAPGRITTPDTPTPNGNRIAVVDPAVQWASDPRRGFRSPREYILSVMEAGRGHQPDPRLLPLRQATVGSDEGRGISDPAGGFLVPVGFSPDLLKIMPEADPMAGLTTRIPMGNPVIRIPARVDKNHTTSVSGGFTVTRRPETVAGTPSQATFEQVTMQANSLFGLSYVTEELLTDSPQSFAAILAAGFSDQFTAHLINERINGTGVGEFEGIMLCPCLVTVTAEQGQAARTILYENITKMWSRCWGKSKAVWLVNHDAMPQLMLLAHVVGTGGLPMWQPSAREGAPSTLFGRPCVETEYCATVGTTGDVILGNWSEYLEGLYEAPQSAESVHVRFVNHERAFKFWLRNAGAPWWKTALTPKNSTATLSPFVVLATR